MTKWVTERSCSSAALSAAGRSRTDRDAVGAAVQHVTGIPAGPVRIDHRQHPVAVREAHETVGGLAIGGVECALTVDDGVAVAFDGFVMTSGFSPGEQDDVAVAR
jgi:hypothetical protein